MRGGAPVLNDLLSPGRKVSAARVVPNKLLAAVSGHDEAAGGGAPGCFVVLHPFVRQLLLRASILVSQEAGERNATRAAPSDEAAADHKARSPVPTAALIGILVIPFVQIVLGLTALLQQLDQERATYAPPAQDAAGYQEAQELALAIGAFLADVLVALVRLLVVLIFPLATPTSGALSEKTRYQGATDAAATEHPAAEDQAQELALVIASRLLAFLVVIILIPLILITLGALFDEMR